MPFALTQCQSRSTFEALGNVSPITAAIGDEPVSTPTKAATGGKSKNDSAKFAGSFAPSFTVNVTKQTVNGSGGGSGAAQGSGSRTSHFILGEPEFNNSEDVRNYFNHVRAVMLQASIELAIAAKILEARLAQAQGLPDDNVVQVRMRAKKVARKVKKTADGATAAAKSIVGAYGAFTREYSDLMRPRPQRPATTNPFRF